MKMINLLNLKMGLQMKKIIFLTLILYSINGFAVNWQKVAQNETGNYFIDFESVKKIEGLIYYSDLVDFIKPYNGNSSAISRYKVDCKEEKQTWLNLATYAEPMGKGKVNSESNPNEEIYPKSNTIYFFFIKKLCNLKN